MAIPYTWRTVEVRGKKSLRMDFPEKYEILSVFLLFDVQTRPLWFYEALDKVLDGKTDQQMIRGNICRLEITPATTKVCDNLAEDGMGNWCEISTAELKHLIEQWITACKTHENLYS